MQSAMTYANRHPGLGGETQPPNNTVLASLNRFEAEPEEVAFSGLLRGTTAGLRNGALSLRVDPRERTVLVSSIDNEER